MTTRIALATGDYRLELLPEIGGAIGSFGWRHGQRGWVELMRPTPQGPEAPKPFETASFPLVPFANRIRDGRFTFAGRSVQMPPSLSGKHYLHGTAWLKPWQVAEASPTRARLVQRHEPDAWPWAFETEQTFALDANGLALTMRTVNRGNEPMPFGFAMHPYFPLTPQCRLDAGVQGWWEGDAEVMPTRHTGVRPDIDPRHGLNVSSVVCDNPFTGWDGTATITWPERGTRLTISAPPPC